MMWVSRKVQNPLMTPILPFLIDNMVDNSGITTRMQGLDSNRMSARLHCL